jgi:hypothetical protein
VKVAGRIVDDQPAALGRPGLFGVQRGSAQDVGTRIDHAASGGGGR